MKRKDEIIKTDLVFVIDLFHTVSRQLLSHQLVIVRARCAVCTQQLEGRKTKKWVGYVNEVLVVEKNLKVGYVTDIASTASMYFQLRHLWIKAYIEPFSGLCQIVSFGPKYSEKVQLYMSTNGEKNCQKILFHFCGSTLTVLVMNESDLITNKH